MTRMQLTVLMALVAIAMLAPCTLAAENSPFTKSLDALLAMPVQYEGRIAPLSAYAASGHRPWGAEELWQDLMFELAGFQILMTAPMYPERDKWLSGNDIRMLTSPTPDQAQFLNLVDSISQATLYRQADEFNSRTAALTAHLAAQRRLLGINTTRVTAESAFIRLRPLAISALLYIVAGIVSWVLVARNAPRWLTAVAVAMAFVVNLACVSLYGYIAGRIPVNNSYEGMLIFSVALGALALVSLASPRGASGAVMGALLAGVVLLAAEYSPIERGITPPVPALQSLWLQVHVLTCFIAYAAFALSFAASWVVLVSRDEGRQMRFDAISYRSVLLGFLFLTAGILTGAAWARQAWGRYWGFDPKETWALVTWLIYAGYLHVGYLSGSRHFMRAVAAVLGFAAVMFTFFGVNYLLTGLHSYG